MSDFWMHAYNVYLSAFAAILIPIAVYQDPSVYTMTGGQVAIIVIFITMLSWRWHRFRYHKSEDKKIDSASSTA